MAEEIREEEETRSESLGQKVTPTVKNRALDIVRRMGYDKWAQDALIELLDTWEEKHVLDNHENYADTVRAINQYTSLINAKLISLISDLDTTEARIRSEYEKKLVSKDQIIHDLQEQRAAQENAKNSAMENASKSRDAQTIAEKHLSDAEERLKKSEETVKDKESIIQMLTSKLKESEEKLAGYDVLRTSESSLRDQVTLVLHQKEIAETKLESETAQHREAQETAARLELQITETQKEKETLHDELQSVKRDLAEQKRAAEQAQELAVQKAIAKAQSEMRDQMAQLRDEKIRLEVQLEMIRSANQRSGEV